MWGCFDEPPDVSGGMGTAAASTAAATGAETTGGTGGLESSLSTQAELAEPVSLYERACDSRTQWFLPVEDPNTADLLAACSAMPNPGAVAQQPADTLIVVPPVAAPYEIYGVFYDIDVSQFINPTFEVSFECTQETSTCGYEWFVELYPSGSDNRLVELSGDMQTGDAPNMVSLPSGPLNLLDVVIGVYVDRDGQGPPPKPGSEHGLVVNPRIVERG